VVKYPDGSTALKWSTNLVIFLVMQHIENSMRMLWKPGLLGGRIILDNSGYKRVPAFIDVGQRVMEEYAMSKIPEKKDK
jgi:hypothetical protein